mgnify:CR=1 FL=1|jgi:hypothetical protein
MINLRVDTIEGGDGNNGPIFEGNLEFSSTAHLVLPKGTTGERPVGVSTGAMRYNTDTSNVEYYNGTSWVEVSSSDLSNRGVFGGGVAPSNLNTIDYISIQGLGNATDFGDLTTTRQFIGACSSSTRGVFGGGTPGPSDVLDYITIATTGNATDFGDLTVARYSAGACSSSTRGVFGGGFSPGAFYNVIDYITIATTGNATDFGDLTVGRNRITACSSSTRGVFGGGESPGTIHNTIDYITIASTGNATDFGDLTVVRNTLSACSSSTRGLFAGGNQTAVPSLTQTNIIDYIIIASTGNATDFGDLTVSRFGLAACSSSTRGVFGGGYTPTPQNVLDYITIATTGNATDFGDLTVARGNLAACSNGHGGLS